MNKENFLCLWMCEVSSSPNSDVLLLSRVFLFSRWLIFSCMWPTDWPMSLSSSQPRYELQCVRRRLLESIPIRKLQTLQLWSHQVNQWFLWSGMTHTIQLLLDCKNSVFSSLSVTSNCVIIQRMLCKFRVQRCLLSQWCVG